MHRPSLRLCVLLPLVLAFAACDSADPGDGNNANCDSGSMSATAAGQAFVAECVSIDISNGNLTIAGITNLDGSDGPTQRQINIGGVAASAGTYAPTVATYADVEASNPTGGTLCAASPIPGAGSSTITIEAADATSARGTFSFTAVCPDDGSSVTVANGEFDISE